MKIKVKLCGGDLPKISPKGDWIDLTTAEDVDLKGPSVGKLMGNGSRVVSFDSKKVSFGLAMQLPEGCEAHVIVRSSTPGKYNVELRNSFGMIDNCYKGNEDVWKAELLAYSDIHIPAHTRIAQFKIVPSQFATPWQKIKWLFINKFEFVEVADLSNDNRKGFGEGTGK